jgi:hypothetical protein
MSQGTLSFNYKLQNSFEGSTQFAGLAPFIDLIFASGLHRSIDKHICARTDTQGYTDCQMLLSLILLNLAGGKCIEHINVLENDNGLTRLVQHLEHHELSNVAKTNVATRWHKVKERTFPSPTAIFDYLRCYHDATTMEVAQKGSATIPLASELQKKLLLVIKEQIEYAQTLRPSTIATIEQDATIKQSYKSTCLYCYKSYRGYQPINSYWNEQGLLIHSEFRDGNVPAKFESKRILEESLQQLPDSVKKVFFRTDGAGYQEEVLSFCAEGKHPKFGVIEFAISASVCQEFKKSAQEVPEEQWHNIVTIDEFGNQMIHAGQEWAEVVYVPEWASHKKSNPDYRFIAIREYLHDDVKREEKDLPFPTYDVNNKRYKLFGIVSNRFNLDGNELITWHRQRCGKSEDVHKEEKFDLSCKLMPSNLFGVNMAFWLIMVLSFNLTHLIQRFNLNASVDMHIETLRRQWIQIPGRVVYHGRRLEIKLDHNQAYLYETLIAIRIQIKHNGTKDPPHA